MLQVLVLVGKGPNQRPLKLGEVPVLGARGAIRDLVSSLAEGAAA